MNSSLKTSPSFDRKATSGRNNDSRTQTTVVGNYLSKHQVRDRFQVEVCKYTPHQLSTAAGTTIDGAKHWINGTRTPDTTSVLNMARSLPSIAMLVAEEADLGRLSQDRFYKFVKQLALQETDEGRIARQLLRAYERGE